MTPRQLAELAQEDGRGAVDKLHALVARAYAERDEALARADKLAQLLQAASGLADAYAHLHTRCGATVHDPALLTEGLPGADLAHDLVRRIEALGPIAGARAALDEHDPDRTRGMRDRIRRRLGLGGQHTG